MPAETRGGFAFSWGHEAVQILRELKSEEENGNRLPPFPAKRLRLVGEETERQFRRVGAMQANAEVDPSDKTFQSTALISLEAALYNRRCVRAFATARREALCDAYWQVGLNLPKITATHLSKDEEAFFRTYAGLCSRRMEQLGVGNLREFTRCPPPIMDAVQVRALKNLSFISTITGGSVEVDKDQVATMPEEEARPLVEAGDVQVVIDVRADR
eukprot:Hpha_TRINITY_DN26477_c0_g1::TRINITY_DN26477_c0_g1_i1::g.34023::m.34023/K10732/GINS1, PSF1; GINS complex subunit 1